MLPGPSTILMDLMRNVGIFAYTSNGGVELSVWRYCIRTGRPEPLQANQEGLRSDFRDPRYIAALDVAFQADRTWRLHRTLPPPFREVPLPSIHLGSRFGL